MEHLNQRFSTERKFVRCLVNTVSVRKPQEAFLKEWTDLTKLADSGCNLVIYTNGYQFFLMFTLLLCNDLFQDYI